MQKAQQHFSAVKEQKAWFIYEMRFISTYSLSMKYLQLIFILVLFWFDQQYLINVSNLLISFKVSSQILGQPYCCPIDSDVTLRDLD